MKVHGSYICFLRCIFADFLTLERSEMVAVAEAAVCTRKG